MNHIRLFFLLLIQMPILLAQNPISIKAKQAFDNKNYKEAIKNYTKVIDEGKAEYLDYYYRGVSQNQVGNLQEAYNDYSRSVKLASDFSEAYFMRGTMLVNPQQVQDAINDLNMAVKYAKNDTIKVLSLINRASAKLYTQNFESAIRDCKEALKVDSTSKLAIGAYVNLSTCYGHQKKHDESISILLKVFKMDSMDVAILTNLGFEYSLIERHEDALKYFDRSLKINPDDAFTYSNKSYALLKLGKVSEAMTAINKSISINPANSYAYKNQGLIYLEMKEKDKACLAFQTAKQKGFVDMYGNEIIELLKKHCD